MAKKPIDVEALKHDAATRRNIPTAEYESVMRAAEKSPVQLAYERRNRDLDPQLVWRGKDEQDWSDLIVQAPPLYIQEKVHPKAIIDDLQRRTKERKAEAPGETVDLFADFNGLGDSTAATEFYSHDQHWSNRMISGDSLSVMASLAEREGLRGKVQCIYLDPPYGIRFNSNFQWSTTSRDVKDGAKDHVTREPEQVRAFRDTWRDGIHSYLTYLRDRLTVARDLLHDSGSIFVQIGDENVHRVRALMDEVFGDENFVSQISTKTSGGSTGEYLANVVDAILWYSKRREHLKYRPICRTKGVGEEGAEKYTKLRLPDLSSRSIASDEKSGTTPIDSSARVYRQDNMTSQSVGRDKGEGAASWFPVQIFGVTIRPNARVRWKTNELGMDRLLRSSRIEHTSNSIAYVRFLDDFAAIPLNNSWDDVGGVQSRADPKVYVVQTPTTIIQRCILMTTDPGDLVLDPTCGSGTTAYVAEQWGRRWITIDTSRVAIALARSRLMGARYPWYLLADSPEGQKKEGEVSRTPARTGPTRGDIRLGFVYERVPHITLKSIANNAEIDVIWERLQPAVEVARHQLNDALRGQPELFKVTTGGRAGQTIDFRQAGDVTLPSGEPAPAGGFMEWEIPREAPPSWPAPAEMALANFWQARIARQQAIDASIAAKAEFEHLYDKPYVDNACVRVAGPFTVESLSPHRTMAVDWDDELIEQRGVAEAGPGVPFDGPAPEKDFAGMILENLKTAGVQQAHKEDRITFTSLRTCPRS
jgi:adenine-specific DNA-methyltransferase